MPELLTIEQVAERLQVDDETVRRWLVKGKLKGSKLNNRLWRIAEADVTDFFESAKNTN